MSGGCVLLECVLVAGSCCGTSCLSMRLDVLLGLRGLRPLGKKIGPLGPTRAAGLFGPVRVAICSRAPYRKSLRDEARTRQAPPRTRPATIAEPRRLHPRLTPRLRPRRARRRRYRGPPIAVPTLPRPLLEHRGEVTKDGGRHSQLLVASRRESGLPPLLPFAPLRPQQPTPLARQPRHHYAPVLL